MFCECFGERTPFQQGRVQLQDTSQKGRSKKRIHYEFVLFRNLLPVPSNKPL